MRRGLEVTTGDNLWHRSIYFLTCQRSVKPAAAMRIRSRSELGARICARRRQSGLAEKVGVTGDRSRTIRLDSQSARLAADPPEDLCQAFGVDPSRKYQNDAGPGPKAIVEPYRMNEIRRGDWLKFAEQVGFDSKPFLDRIVHTADAIPDLASEVGAELKHAGLTRRPGHRPASYTPGWARLDRSKRIAR